MADPRQTGDIERRLANLTRKGTIDEIDHATGRVRVKIGALKTAWIQWLVRRAGSNRGWEPPSLNEQVLLLAPSGDLAQAVVLGSLYSDAYPAPADSGDVARHVFPDGSTVEYDSASGTLTVNAASKAVVVASDIRLGSAGASDPVVRRSDLQAALDQLIAAYNGHTHAAPPGGGTTSTTSAPASVTAAGSPVTSSD